MSSAALAELILSDSVQRYSRPVQSRRTTRAALGTGTENKAQLPDRPICYHFQGPVVSEPGLRPALHGELERSLGTEPLTKYLG